MPAADKRALALSIVSFMLLAPKDPPVTSKVVVSAFSPKNFLAATTSFFVARAVISGRIGIPTNSVWLSLADRKAFPAAVANLLPKRLAMPGRAFPS